jgi:hypothetical protein
MFCSQGCLAIAQQKRPPDFIVLCKGVAQSPHEADWPLRVFTVIERQPRKRLLDPDLRHALSGIIPLAGPWSTRGRKRFLEDRLSAHDVIQHQHVHNDKLRYVVFRVNEGCKVFRSKLSKSVVEERELAETLWVSV